VKVAVSSETLVICKNIQRQISEKRNLQGTHLISFGTLPINLILKAVYRLETPKQTTEEQVGHFPPESI
jgi:hypothetical protein